MSSIIPEWASKYVGLQYEDRGRGPVKFDCWGLVRVIIKDQTSLELPSYSTKYEASVRDPRVEVAMIAGMSDSKTYRQVQEPKHRRSLDIVIFNIAGRPVHCGVLLTPTHFLHIHAGTGSVVDGLESPRWASRIAGVYRPF